MLDTLDRTLLDQLGILGIPLLVCGSLILAIVLERVLFFLTTYPLSQQLLDELVKPRSDDLPEDIRRKVLRNRFGVVLLELMGKRRLPREERETFCAVRMVDLERSMNRYLPLLKVLATISPLLGLLGTVLGMIDSFQLISTVNKPITPALVSGGIAEALLTTTVGLMLAILALVPLALFQMRANTLMQKLSQHMNLVNLTLQQAARRRQIARRNRELKGKST